MDGKAVLALARDGKEKAIADAMNQHFIEHPFATVAKALAADASVDSALSGEADSPLRLTYGA